MFNRTLATPTALSNDDLFKKAPSIFAKKPWDQVSAAYKFIPTFEIIENMRKEGFVPVRAQQSKSRIEGKSDFTKHMVRFRHLGAMTGAVLNQEIPEIVLVNSHDRTSGYQLSAGLFRLVCLNGMVVKSSDLGSISVRHSGNIIDQVIEGSYKIVDEMPRVLDQVGEFKEIKMLPEEANLFAKAALELRYPTAEDGNQVTPIVPEQLLRVRRREDQDASLWSTFNRVQENFIKGGLRGRSTTGGRMSTRAINSVSEDIRLNKALWVLAESMKALKA